MHYAQDLHLNQITPRHLDFSSPFTLTATVSRRTKVNTLILYFDTFFTVSGRPVPTDTPVKVIKEDDLVLAEVWPVGGKPPPLRRQSQSQSHNLTGKDKEEGEEKITSFSTGPKSVPTHWKQTLFFLREPIVVDEGSPSFPSPDRRLTCLFVQDRLYRERSAVARARRIRENSMLKYTIRSGITWKTR